MQLDTTKHFAYTNLAVAYLLQGKYNDAVYIYNKYKNEFKEQFLEDIEKFVKAKVIPANRMADVEKIKIMLKL